MAHPSRLMLVALPLSGSPLTPHASHGSRSVNILNELVHHHNLSRAGENACTYKIKNKINAVYN